MPLPKSIESELKSGQGLFVQPVKNGFHIDLKNQGLDDEDVIRLVGLCAGKQIISLDVTYNNIGDEGAKSIASGFPSLEVLNIKQNNVEDEGILALVKNKHLKILDISQNALTKKGLDVIESISAKSKTDDNLGSTVKFLQRRRSNSLIKTSKEKIDRHLKKSEYQTLVKYYLDLKKKWEAYDVFVKESTLETKGSNHSPKPRATISKFVEYLAKKIKDINPSFLMWLEENRKQSGVNELISLLEKEGYHFNKLPQAGKLSMTRAFSEPIGVKLASLELFKKKLEQLCRYGYTFVIKRPDRHTFHFHFNATDSVLAGKDKIRAELTELSNLFQKFAIDSGISLEPSQLTNWKDWTFILSAPGFDTPNKVVRLLQHPELLPYLSLTYKAKAGFFRSFTSVEKSLQEALEGSKEITAGCEIQ